MRDEPFFVSVATVAAGVGEMRDIASELLFAAINAKIIALRAGSAAAGFQPITDFIDQTARATAMLGDAIESGTQAASRLAVSERLATRAMCYVRRTMVGAGTDAQSLQAVIDRFDTDRIALSESVSRSVHVLDDLLAQIGKCMRSISVITVQSRIEAQQAGVHRVDLEGVAAAMAHAAQRVSAIVQQSRRDLRDAVAARAKQRMTV